MVETDEMILTMNKIEKEIILTILENAFHLGYSITVYSNGEDVVKKSKSKERDMIIAGIPLTERAVAVLMATRNSPNAQNLEQLARSVEADPPEVAEVLEGLVVRDILQAIEIDGKILYGYADTWWSQTIYEAIHRVPPIHIAGEQKT